MKKVKVMLVATLVLMLIACSALMGCTPGDDQATAGDDQATVGSDQDATQDTDQDAEIEYPEEMDLTTTIDQCLALLGKNDADAATAFNGGTENHSADGTLLVGRAYPLQVFGEKLSLESLYDEQGNVSSMNLLLGEQDEAGYKTALTEALGAPAEENTEANESGAITTVWKVNEHTVTLYHNADNSNILELS
ncbi:MAG: hypothetical protein RR051_01230, partial [Clostridiales bacterium]